MLLLLIQLLDITYEVRSYECLILEKSAIKNTVLGMSHEEECVCCLVMSVASGENNG